MSNTHSYVLRARLSHCSQWQEHLHCRRLLRLVLAVFLHIPVGGTAPLHGGIPKSVYHHYDPRQASNETDDDDVRDGGWVLNGSGTFLRILIIPKSRDTLGVFDYRMSRSSPLRRCSRRLS